MKIDLHALGLPQRYSSLRKEQKKLVEDIISSKSPYTVHTAPTGVGKTLAYVAAALVKGWRTVILTHTKALQDQILRDFPDLVFDLRGASNYACLSEEGFTCEDGRVAGCSNPKCPYRMAISKAAASRIVVTNYSMWLLLNQSGSPLPRPDLLVCDEAHTLLGAVDSHCSPVITQQMAEETGLADADLALCDPARWIEWAKKASGEAERRLDRARALIRSGTHGLRNAMDSLRLWSEISRTAGMLLEIQPDDKVVPYSVAGGWALSPIEPSQSFHQYLVHGVKRVAFLSATINAQDLYWWFGLSEGKEQFDYRSPFDPRRCPVYLVTGPALSRFTGEEAWRRVFDIAARIVDQRRGKRGIVHTVSYDRAAAFCDYCGDLPISDRLVRHAPGARNLFLARSQYLSRPSSVLVSPALTTGHDFPYGDCEFQILLKAPYTDLSHPLAHARAALSSDAPNREMVRNLIQICGRNMRHEDDWGETIILDGQVKRVMDRLPSAFPVWFRERLVTVSHWRQSVQLPTLAELKEKK